MEINNKWEKYLKNKINTFNNHFLLLKKPNYEYKHDNSWKEYITTYTYDFKYFRIPYDKERNLFKLTCKINNYENNLYISYKLAMLNNSLKYKNICEGKYDNFDEFNKMIKILNEDINFEKKVMVTYKDDKYSHFFSDNKESLIYAFIIISDIYHYLNNVTFFNEK